MKKFKLKRWFFKACSENQSENMFKQPFSSVVNRQFESIKIWIHWWNTTREHQTWSQTEALKCVRVHWVSFYLFQAFLFHFWGCLWLLLFYVVFQFQLVTTWEGDILKTSFSFEQINYSLVFVVGSWFVVNVKTLIKTFLPALMIYTRFQLNVFLSFNSNKAVGAGRIQTAAWVSEVNLWHFEDLFWTHL